MLLLIASTRCANLAHSMLNLINSYRSQEGLGPLKSIQNLEDAARDQALYMCEKSILTHENPRGNLKQRIRRHGFRGLSIGENIAKNHGDGYMEVGRMWMVSQGHRKNIMGNFTYSGIATCLDENENRYWVQVFGGEGGGYEESAPAGNRMDGPFLLSDEPVLDSLKESCNNLEDQDKRYREGSNNNIGYDNDLGFDSNVRTGRALPSRSRGTKLPGLSYGPRRESAREICFNIDSCMPGQAAHTFTSIPASSVISKLTVTQMKTSYIPVSSVIYRTFTETVSLSTESTVSIERPPTTQTVFMIINASVPTPTTVPITIPQSESTGTTSSVQNISTVTVTSSTFEPVVVKKTVTVTETPEPRNVTVTVTSRSQLPVSTVSVEKTVTVTSRSQLPVSTVSVEKTVTETPNQQLSEVITVVERRIAVPPMSRAEVEVPRRINLEVATVPDLESDHGLEYVPRYGEPWGETKAPIYETVSLPLNLGVQGYSQSRRLLMPRSRSYSRQERQDDDGAEMPKYPKGDEHGRQYLRTYYINNHVASKDSSGPESENKSQEQAHLNNPCGGRDNPCIRTILVRG